MSAAPSEWVVRHAELFPSDANILDVASGKGRHTRYFIERGHRVTAVDLNLDGVQDLQSNPNMTLLQADLERGDPWPFQSERYGAVVVTNYLWRPIFPDLLNSVANGGLLIYETFADGNEAYGKPSRPEFLLKPNELKDLVKDTFSLIAFEEGYVEAPKPAVTQRICAMRSE
jgi:SAM-dependent methyltransferase